MFTKCSVCGKVVLTFLKSAKECPRCGSNLIVKNSTRDTKTQLKIQFPLRENPSFEDGLKQRHLELYEGGAIGNSTLFDSWESILSRRGFDIPYYTAINNRACLLIYFSSQLLRNEEQLETILNSGLRLPLQIEAFLTVSFPILRCNLVIPDDPTDPFCLETPLNIRDGDVQDFFGAAIANEYIDLIVKHEGSQVGRHYAVECHAPGLSTMVEREVKRAIRALKPKSTREDYEASIQVMEATFPAATAGVYPSKCVALTVCGKAKNASIWYGDTQLPAPEKEIDRIPNNRAKQSTARRETIADTFERLLETHYHRMKEDYGSLPQYVDMEHRWKRLVHADVLAFSRSVIDYSMNQSLQDHTRYDQDSRFSEGLYLVISTVPALAPTQVMAHFPGGYIKFLDNWLKRPGFDPGNHDFAHFVFCYDGETTGFHLTYLPAAHDENFIAIFAQDLMTKAEKIKVGLL